MSEAKSPKYDIIYTPKFLEGYAIALKRGYDIAILKKVISILAAGEALPAKYRDHKLKGRWAKHRECHLKPDWLLIYHIDKDILSLSLTATGTHSDLF